MRKVLLCACLFVASFYSANAQINIPAAGRVIEKFTALAKGKPTASLPSNWKLSAPGRGRSAGWSSADNLSSFVLPSVDGVTASANTPNAGSNATNGAFVMLYNGTSVDTSALMARYRNKTGKPITTLTVAFEVKPYQATKPAYELSFATSTNGTAWTTIKQGGVASGVFKGMGSLAAAGNPQKVIKLLTISGLNIPNKGDFYLRWLFTPVGNAAAGSGLSLDNVSLGVGALDFSAPSVSATLVDQQSVDVNNNGQVNGGDEITYTATVTNNGGADATSVTFNATVDANTTLVPNSVITSALARNDAFTTSVGQTITNTAINVLSNDFGLPSISVLSYGTSASGGTGASPGTATATDHGGSVTLSAAGQITSYTPPPSNYAGTDGFKYVAKDANNLGSDVGTVTITLPDIVIAASTVANPKCHDGSDGSITVNASGGVNTLAYAVVGVNGGAFQSSNVFTGLRPNTYTIQVKDGGGYVKTSTATVNNPAAIVVNGTIPQLTYTRGMLNVQFSKTNGSGTPANPWSASGLPGGVTIDPTSGVVSGTPTATGSFNAILTYTDANGCIGTSSSTVLVGPKIVGEIYSTVGNTQLLGGATAPSTPYVAVSNLNTNDASDAAITYAVVTGPAHGSLTALNTNGTFLYTPTAGNTTQDVFTYSGTSNGVATQNTATINFNGMVWYIQGGAAAGGDGRSNSPRNSMPSGMIGSPGDFIYVSKEISGITPGYTTLMASQRLIGAGATLNVPATGTILSIPGVAANTPTLGDGINLANSVVVDGIDLNTGANSCLVGTNTTGISVNIRNVTTNGTGFPVSLVSTSGTVAIAGGTLTNSTTAAFLISGGSVSLTYGGSINQGSAAPMVNVNGGHTGTITFQTGTLSATNGSGLLFDNADGTYNFNGTVSLNGGDAGIDILNGSNGNFSFLNAPITNPSGVAFNVNGGSGSITHSGTISKTSAGKLIDIQSRTGGSVTLNGNLSSTSSSTGINVSSCNSSTITFAGGTKTLTTGANTAVTLATNAFSTINFTNGGLGINTGDGVGFSATGAGTVNVTTDGGSNNTVSKSGNGYALIVNGISAGAGGINFSSVNVTAGTGTAVQVFNSGGTKSLGDLDVARSGGGTAIFASNGGTVNTTTGSINSGNQIAIDIDNTALGMTLERVDVNGASGGIDLNTTTGTFTVNGTLTTDGTGGTIQNTTGRGASFVNTGSLTLKNMNFTNAGTTNFVNPSGGGGATDNGDVSPANSPNYNLNVNAAIHLVNITGVTLDNLNLNGGAQQGINGNNVTNFSLANSTIQGFGNEVREDGIHFKDMLGTSSISDCTIGGSTASTNNAAVQVHIENSTGAVGTKISFTNLNVQSRGFAASGVTWSSGITFIAQSIANAKLFIQNCTINNVFSNCLETISESTGAMEVIIKNNTFTNVGAGGINLAQNNTGSIRFDISNNGTAAIPTFLRGTNSGASHPININQAGGATSASVLEGQIVSNYIGDNSSSTSASAGGTGIRVFQVGAGTTTVKINDNIVKGALQGLLISCGEETNPTQNLNATVYNNSFTVTEATNGFEGVTLNAGTVTGDKGTMRLDFHDNTASTNASGGNFDFRIRQRFLTTTQWLNYGGANNSNSALQTYLTTTKNNVAAPGGNGDWDIGQNVAGGGGGFGTTASVPQPTLPASN